MKKDNPNIYSYLQSVLQSIVGAVTFNEQINNGTFVAPAEIKEVFGQPKHSNEGWLQYILRIINQISVKPCGKWVPMRYYKNNLVSHNSKIYIASIDTVLEPGVIGSENVWVCYN